VPDRHVESRSVLEGDGERIPGGLVTFRTTGLRLDPACYRGFDSWCGPLASQGLEAVTSGWARSSPAVGSIMDRVFFPFEVTRGRISECDSRGRVPRIVKLLDNPPNSRAVFLVIAGAFVHDRRPTITPNRIFVIAGLIGKGSDSSASGKIKSDCFLPHRCIQKLRSFSTNEILWNFHSHFMFTGISINPSSELRSKIQFEVEKLVVHRRRTFLVNLDEKERYSFCFGSNIWS
jgi:hypothetical protein